MIHYDYAQLRLEDKFKLNDDGDDSSTDVVDSEPSVYYNDARGRA